MFVTAPPRHTAMAGASAPHLAGITHLTYRPADGRHVAEYPPSPASLRYLADMVTPYGVPYSEERFVAGNHNSFAHLTERLLAAAGTSPDLVLIAHAAPDCEPGRSLSGYLSTLLPNEPLVFAVSDQGELSPFCALRILHGYITAGWRRDGLLLILDQSTLPYPGSRPPGHERTDHAIGLSFTTGTGGTPARGPALTGVTLRFDVPPTGLTAALADIAAELPTVDGPVTVVAGGAVLRRITLPAALDGHVWIVGSGPSCVPPWAALATLCGAGATGRIALIEYDESLAGLAVAVFDAPAEPEASR